MIFLRVLWSGIGMVDGHGKLQGTVMQKGRSGAIARVKVNPVNTRSAFQQARRSLFAYFSSKFRTLGASVVNAWNAAAANGFTSTNVFGNPFKKTGHALYVGLNLNLSLVEEAELTSPPTPEGVPSPILFDPSMAVATTDFFTAVTFVGATTTIPADTSMVIYATPPLSGGVSFVNSQLRMVSFQQAGDNTATDDKWAAYVARFGAPVAGDRIGIQVVTINQNTGEAGIPWKQIITVAA